MVQSVFYRQPGLSLSSFFANARQNSAIMLWLELDWASAMYTLPRVSTAVSMLTLGVIWKAPTEFLEPGACHFLRLQSCMPSQVSSRFRTT